VRVKGSATRSSGHAAGRFGGRVRERGSDLLGDREAVGAGLAGPHLVARRNRDDEQVGADRAEDHSRGRVRKRERRRQEDARDGASGSSWARATNTDPLPVRGGPPPLFQLSLLPSNSRQSHMWGHQRQPSQTGTSQNNQKAWVRLPGLNAQGRPARVVPASPRPRSRWRLTPTCLRPSAARQRLPGARQGARDREAPRRRRLHARQGHRRGCVLLLLPLRQSSSAAAASADASHRRRDLGWQGLLQSSEACWLAPRE
jgi:hypothetical protein